jgi:hypothetical protein
MTLVMSAGVFQRNPDGFPPISKTPVLFTIHNIATAITVNMSICTNSEDASQSNTHTLDLEAIAEAQTNNAAILRHQQEEMNDLRKKMFEERGYYLGQHLCVDDMAWLGAGRFSSLQGGWGTTMVNNAAIFPSFQQLKRPGTLPGKNRISLENHKVQAWVNKIWNGECVYYAFPNDGDGQDGESPCVELAVTTTDNKTLMSCDVHALKSDKWTRIMLHPMLQELLDSSEVDLLTARMMHHFLRSYAYLIPAENVWEVMTSPKIHSPLTSKKCKEEFLDWQILRADLTLNLPAMTTTTSDDDMADSINSALCEVGGALASMSRWEEAALLFVEIGDAFKKNKKAYEYAADGFLYTGNPHKSLEMMLKHIGRLGEHHPNLDVNQEPYSELLGKLMLVHHALFEASLSQHNRNILVVSKEDVTFSVGYLALLRVAGYKLVGTANFDFEEFMGTTPAAARALLKDKWLEPKHAKQALLNLLKSKSIDAYMHILSQAVKSNTPLLLAHTGDTTRSDDLRQFMSGNSAKSACTVAKGKIMQARCCAHCEKWSSLGDDDDDVDCKACPCSKVYYCNGTCQRADWKRHKKVCAWYRKNKQQDGENKQNEGDNRLECSACGKVDSKSRMKFCPCHDECYCCKPCQVKDWPKHKRVCASYHAKK